VLHRQLRARFVDRHVGIRTYRARPFALSTDREGPFSRHLLLGGFSQKALSKASVALIGAGGVNGQVAEGLSRKGIGRLVIWDGDAVVPSNLNRQFFRKGQIGTNKAHALAEGLIEVATAATSIVAVPWYFPDERALELMTGCDIVVCAPCCPELG
jgi:adenylyltransferase/sulfurtransferase